jgi:predicted outer membrane protein
MSLGKHSVAAIFSTCAIGLVLLIAPVRAGDASAEVDFVNRASVGNLFAIEESELALRRADASEVKYFAQQLIDAHEKA